MNAKGISPLIAVILLVAFVVAAAGILSNFVLPFIREEASETTTRGSEDIRCRYANIFITDANWNSTDTKIELTIENKGREDLEDFKATAIRANRTTVEMTLDPTDATLHSGDIQTFTNSTALKECSPLDEIVARSDTCPSDARYTVEKSAISNC